VLRELCLAAAVPKLGAVGRKGVGVCGVLGGRLLLVAHAAQGLDLEQEDVLPQDRVLAVAATLQAIGVVVAGSVSCGFFGWLN